MIAFVRVGFMSYPVSLGIPSSLYKKKDGKLCMAVDYQNLSAQTMPERHLIPCIDVLLDFLHEYTHFTKINL